MGHSGAAEVSVRHRLAWDFDEQSQSFELAAEPGGCRLTFVTTVDDLPVAQTATGWHTYLSRLEPHLAGGFVSEDDAHTSWRAIHEGCAERFGLDPEPGRRWAAQICPPRKADRSRTLPLSVSAPD